MAETKIREAKQKSWIKFVEEINDNRNHNNKKFCGQ